MESATQAFSVCIFVAGGLRLVGRSNWVGKALMFPRALLPQVKQRRELEQTGVCLLVCPRADGEGDTFDVGEVDSNVRRVQPLRQAMLARVFSQSLLAEAA